MAFDETLAERVRGVLAHRVDLSEKRMFGGLTFLLGGNMCCGVHGSELILRLGPERAEQALQVAHVGPMDFTGRPMRGFVTVQPEGLAGDELRRWVDLAVEFAEGLPSKGRTGRGRLRISAVARGYRRRLRCAIASSRYETA
jgi:hypothetical protein